MRSRRHANLSSTKLAAAWGENYWYQVKPDEEQKKMALKCLKNEILCGYQAHHIIPVQILRILDVPVEDYEYYNGSWNCMMIPSEKDVIIHRGSHPYYNQCVANLVLTNIENGMDMEQAMKDVISYVLEQYNSALEKLRPSCYGKISLSMDDFARMYLLTTD